MARKCRLYTTDVTFSVSCELFQPMDKTEFSSTARIRTNSVSQVKNNVRLAFVTKLRLHFIYLTLFSPLIFNNA